jgi:hypothetical protein
MTQSGLDDFRGVWKEYRRLWVGLAGASVPFVAAFSGVTPPWPPKIALLTAVIQLMVIVYVYQAHSRFSSQKSVTRGMRVSAILFVLSFFFYIFLFSQFAIFIPSREEYLIVGYQCSQRALDVYRDSCPSLGLTELSAAQYDEFVLWTRFSISSVRIALVALWFLFFVGLSAFIGEFIVYQRRQRVEG